MRLAGHDVGNWRVAEVVARRVRASRMRASRMRGRKVACMTEPRPPGHRYGTRQGMVWWKELRSASDGSGPIYEQDDVQRNELSKIKAKFATSI